MSAALWQAVRLPSSSQACSFNACQEGLRAFFSSSTAVHALSRASADSCLHNDRGSSSSGLGPACATPQRAAHAHAHPSATHSHMFKPLKTPADPRRPAALFVDAAGTILHPSENVADVYLRNGAPYGITRDPQLVLQGFREAYNTWEGKLRYVGAGHEFWRRVVFHSLGTADERAFEDIYMYYSRAEAWTVPAGMREALARVRAAGVKTCVVSNFDNRLRPLLATLALDSLFDSVIVSSEVGAEKPSPKIFDAACVATGVDPSRELVVHVGDDRRNDVWGARASGISGWLWGDDVTSFEEIADRIVTGHMAI